MRQPLMVVPVPCLSDNYAYLIYSSEGDGEALVVDPSEAEPVVLEVERRGLRLKGIFNTHHHFDHVGGNRQLLQRAPLEVFAHESEAERIPGLSRPLGHEQAFEFVGLSFFVLHVPGHTRGALALCTSDHAACFTGDTLFCAGCGRLFEGSPSQMYHSLNHVLGQLPDTTVIYCGHEYTEKNLRFARSVDASEAVVERMNDVSQRREQGLFCGSATMKLERETNPFLRCSSASIRHSLGGLEDDEAVFAALRAKKDRA